MIRSAVHGFVDRLDVLPTAFAGPILPSGAAIALTGWAVNGNRPARRITVAVVGGPAFAATGGLERRDVAAEWGESACGAGFQAWLPTAALAPGAHAVHVIADGTPIGNAVRLRIARADTAFAVDALPLQPAVVDEALVLGRDPHGTTAPAPAQREETILVRGWADNPPGEAPHRTVLGVVEGGSVFVGCAGLPRPDVAAFFGDAARHHTGFRLYLPLLHVRPGEHRLRLLFGSAPDCPRGSAERQVRFVVLP